MTRVLGVDFSGASEPGESVWVATATLDDGLRVERCRSAGELTGETGRAAVLSGLVDRVDGASVVGFDFPFGLPRAVVETLGGPDRWRECVEWVGRFADADEFTERCQAAARAATDGDRTYLRREADGPVGAKSPYHFFTYKQAFHGTRDVLRPLLERGTRVAPMAVGHTTGDTETGVADRTTAVEVYPAGTLRRLGLPDENYKDTTKAARRTRERILDGLETGGEGGSVTIPDDATRERVLADAGGDALDSVVAAVAAARALEHEFAVDDQRYDPLEGYVYV